jgi:hypothetical protein
MISKPAHIELQADRVLLSLRSKARAFGRSTFTVVQSGGGGGVVEPSGGNVLADTAGTALPPCSIS